MKAEHGGHLDCGCSLRWLIPMGPARCPGCGTVALVEIPPSGMPWPTGTPAGSVMTLEVGCLCGRIYEMVCAVEALA